MWTLINRYKGKIVFILDSILKVVWTTFYIIPFTFFWVVVWYVCQGGDIALLKAINTEQFVSILKLVLGISVFLSTIKNYICSNVDRYRKIKTDIKRSKKRKYA